MWHGSITFTILYILQCFGCYYGKIYTYLPVDYTEGDAAVEYLWEKAEPGSGEITLNNGFFKKITQKMSRRPSMKILPGRRSSDDTKGSKISIEAEKSFQKEIRTAENTIAELEKLMRRADVNNRNIARLIFLKLSNQLRDGKRIYEDLFQKIEAHHTKETIAPCTGNGKMRNLYALAIGRFFRSHIYEMGRLFIEDPRDAHNIFFSAIDEQALSQNNNHLYKFLQDRVDAGRLRRFLADALTEMWELSHGVDEVRHITTVPVEEASALFLQRVGEFALICVASVRHEIDLTDHQRTIAWKLQLSEELSRIVGTLNTKKMEGDVIVDGISIVAAQGTYNVRLKGSAQICLKTYNGDWDKFIQILIRKPFTSIKSKAKANALRIYTQLDERKIQRSEVLQALMQLAEVLDQHSLVDGRRAANLQTTLKGTIMVADVKSAITANIVDDYRFVDLVRETGRELLCNIPFENRRQTRQLQNMYWSEEENAAFDDPAADSLAAYNGVEATAAAVATAARAAQQQQQGRAERDRTSPRRASRRRSSTTGGGSARRQSRRGKFLNEVTSEGSAGPTPTPTPTPEVHMNPKNDKKQGQPNTIMSEEEESGMESPASLPPPAAAAPAAKSQRNRLQKSSKVNYI